MKSTLIGLLVAGGLAAQITDPIPLKHWPAPLYWQAVPEPVPEPAIGSFAAEHDGRSLAAIPAGLLVFVAIPPCRLVDTRNANGAFGGPIMNGNTTRNFAVPAGSCAIPPTAQAYSFNVTVQPSGFLGYLTIWPTGQTQPNVSTLNAPLGQVLANAAIVPAGTNGSVSVYVLNTTHVIIDVNGYYAAPSGLTLAAGTPVAPSLSFAGDAGTGIFSFGAGMLNLATGGANRLSVRPDGDLDMTGNLRKGGSLFLHDRGDIFNTGAGLHALENIGGGAGNSAFGDSALRSMIGGLSNTAVGDHALEFATDYQNVAMGSSALRSLTFGSANVAIGYRAGSALSTGYSNIYLGSAGASNEDGTTRIGSGFSARAFLAGVRGTQTGAGDAVAVLIDSAGQLGTVNSSRRVKEDIQDMGDWSDALLRLRPVTFRYKQPYADGSQPKDYGLIAEEVAEVFPDLVVYGKDGLPETVQYHKLNTLLVNELQKQQAKIQSLEADLAAIKALLRDGGARAAGQ